MTTLLDLPVVLWFSSSTKMRPHPTLVPVLSQNDQILPSSARSYTHACKQPEQGTLCHYNSCKNWRHYLLISWAGILSLYRRSLKHLLTRSFVRPTNTNGLQSYWGITSMSSIKRAKKIGLPLLSVSRTNEPHLPTLLFPWLNEL